MEIKKPFNISRRADIEAGKCRVVTANHYKARVICWDRQDSGDEDFAKEPIVALVETEDTSLHQGREIPMTFRANGIHGGQFHLQVVYDVPDISEFEGLLYEALLDANGLDSDIILQITKNYAPTLLKAARLRIEGRNEQE